LYERKIKDHESGYRRWKEEVAALSFRKTLDAIRTSESVD